MCSTSTPVTTWPTHAVGDFAAVTTPGAVRAALPGLAFAVALAFAAKSVSLASGGALSSILCAILFGILWRNVAGIGGWADAGVEFAGNHLLRAGIALIGLRLTLVVLTGVSLAALPVVIACIAVALLAAMAFGRLFGVTPGLQRLLAAGTAICGCTAIIALAPVLRSRQQDVGIAIACVVLFGSAAMVGYPWIAHYFFGGEVAAAGMFFGASIQDTSQVVGAALIYSQQFDAPDAVAVAGLTKFMRTFGLLVLVPLTAMWMARGAAAPGAAGAGGLRARALPWFVVAFIAFAIVRTAGDFWLDGPAWRAFLQTAQQASEMLLLCGMAAIGLGVTFANLREAGWRPLAVAFLAAAATGATAIAFLEWCRVALIALIAPQ
ncbi:MAG: putative sulfate exporter family transporter [Gammaproteobacteria bacterium]|nr:putative sulfate exporter family transporter [Gammaproteobacteria bacterium]